MDRHLRFYRSLSILLNFLAAMYLSWFMRVKLSGGEEVDLTWQYYVNTLWLLSPYLALAVLSLREQSSRMRSLILLLGTLVVTGCGAWILLDAEYIRGPGQVVETLRVLPWYQWAVCLVAAVITLIDSAIHPKKARPAVDGGPAPKSGEEQEFGPVPGSCPGFWSGFRPGSPGGYGIGVAGPCREKQGHEKRKGKMFIAGVGQGECRGTASAVQLALEQCRAQLGERKPKAGLLFCGMDVDVRGALAVVKQAFPELDLVGCTTSGAFASVAGFSEEAVSLMLLASDSVHMAGASVERVFDDPETAVRQAFSELEERLGGEPDLCLFFPAGGDTQGRLVRAVNDRVQGRFPVFGGQAGGPLHKPSHPVAFHGSRILDQGLVLFGFRGRLAYSQSLSHSWNSVGVRERVAESRGNVVLRIGRDDALSFYRRWMGRQAVPMAEMPLAVYPEGSSGHFVRSPVAHDEMAGTVTFSGPIPQGAMVELTEATREHILADVGESVRAAMRDFPDGCRPSLGLALSCAARKQILGTHTGMELARMAAELPRFMPIAGFYSFAEFAPLESGGPVAAHNCSMVTLLLGEMGGEKGDGVPEFKDVRNLPECRMEAVDGTSMSRCLDEVQFLSRRLELAEWNRERLELNKEWQASLLRSINREVEEARHDIELKNAMLKRSISLADEIQKSLLPGRTLKHSCLEVAARIIYSHQTGGDYYDYLPVPEGDHRIGLVVGDVTGHGVEAALLMTTARALLRLRASQPGTPDRIVNEVNRHLSRDFAGTGRFMTMFMLYLDTDRKRVEWVRAGHDPAMVYHPAEDRFEELAGEGLPLGVAEDWAYSMNTRSCLRPGNVIFLGTDGVWEARDPEGNMFGKDRVREIIRARHHLGADGLADAILEALDEFRAGRGPLDDTTLMVVRVKNASDLSDA